MLYTRNSLVMHFQRISFPDLPAYLSEVYQVWNAIIEKKRKMEKNGGDDLNRVLATDKINSLREIKDERKKDKNWTDNFLQGNNINIYYTSKSQNI